MRTGSSPPFCNPSNRAGMVAVSLAASLLLSACNGGSGDQPVPAVLQDFHGCSATAPSPAPGDTQSLAPDRHGSVPASLHPYLAVLCTLDPVHNVIREDHLEGDITELLAAIAKPGERGGEGVCKPNLHDLPELWLVNTVGEAANVRWPVDGCGNAKPGISAALQALTITTSQEIPANRPAP